MPGTFFPTCSFVSHQPHSTMCCRQPPSYDTMFSSSGDVFCPCWQNPVAVWRAAEPSFAQGFIRPHTRILSLVTLYSTWALGSGGPRNEQRRGWLVAGPEADWLVAGQLRVPFSLGLDLDFSLSITGPGSAPGPSTTTKTICPDAWVFFNSRTELRTDGAVYREKSASD